jgi:outer membrane murein-binding lipoprotein Lpp
MQRDLVIRRPRGLKVLAAACGLLILAGCGGGKAPADQVSLDEQVGLDDEGLLERQKQAENVISECMKTQGFDYVPVDPQAQKAALVGQAGMSSEDFEKQFGYGITTLYDKRLQQTAIGPNKDIRDRLGDADRAAYDRALYGDDPTATFQVALDHGDFTRLGGCTKQAADKVFGGTALVQTLQSKLDEVDEKIFADARMVKAVAKWSQCMREAGYSGLSEPDEVDAVLERKLEAIVGAPEERVAPAAGQEPDYDAGALAALQREEVSMVAADVACEKKHLVETEEAVSAQYFKEFREENADLMARVPSF